MYFVSFKKCLQKVFVTIKYNNKVIYLENPERSILRSLFKETIFCYDVPYFYGAPNTWDAKSIFYLIDNKINPTLEDLTKKTYSNNYELTEKINSIFRLHGKDRWDCVPLSYRKKYMHNEVTICEKYYNVVKKNLDESQFQKMYNQFFQSLYYLQRISKNGFKIDIDLLHKYKSEHSQFIKIIDKMIKSSNNNIINPQFTLFSSNNGRIQSSYKFNMMAIPKKIRNAIISKYPNGKIMVADLRALQFSIAISLAGQKISGDPYDIIVKILNITRDEAKVKCLAALFGQSNVSHEIDNLLSSYGVNRIIEQCIEFVKKHKYIKNSFGRKRIFNDADLKSVRTKAFNALMQMEEVDILKNLMYHIVKKLPKNVDIIFPQHDALVFDLSSEHIEYIQDICNKAISKLDGLYSNNLKFKFHVSNYYY